MFKIKRNVVQFVYNVVRISKPVLSFLLPNRAKKILKTRLLNFANTSFESKRLQKSINSEDYKSGVNLVGYSRAEMGIGESCRIAANSMNAAGIPFGIINFKGTNSARMSDKTWVHKEIKDPIYCVNIFHINAEQIPELNSLYNEAVFKNRYNIGVWHWELPDFPDEWIDSFRYVDEIWAPSTFVAESIALKSPVPVVRIPHSIEVKISQPKERSYFNLPKDVFLFLTMYDVRSFQERKNPEASIRAFQNAFRPNDMTVGLVIKVNSYKVKSEATEILYDLIGNYKNIYIIDETLSRNDVNALISVIDCFISLHRSEGFGLGLAEAMYLGKPAIGTNWSSTTDFMNHVNSCPVNYTLVAVGKDQGPYKAYQQWAEPSIEHASQYMSKLVTDRNYYKAISIRGESFIKEYYSPKKTGERMKRRLDYIRKWEFGG